MYQKSIEELGEEDDKEQDGKTFSHRELDWSEWEQPGTGSSGMYWWKT